LLKIKSKMKKKLKIVIDATPLLKNLTGIGYVTYIYAKSLEKCSKCSYFYVWFWSNELRKRALGGFEGKVNFIKKYLPRPYMVTHSIKTLIFNIGLFVKKPDLVFQPNYNIFKTYKKFPTVIMVHDLSHIRYPSFHPDDRVDYFNKMLDYSIQNSTKVMTISKFTKQEMIDLGMCKEENIEVIYNGVSSKFKPLKFHKNSEQFFTKYKINAKGYILFVGTFEPRKNLNLLLKAYIQYIQVVEKPLDLVLVGTIGWGEEHFDRELQEALKFPSVKRLGYLDDCELRLVYAGAKMFVFPSFYEGFGLPPLEAMASGTAVIASNTSSIPEVVEDAGILINPDDEKTLLENIIRLDTDKNYREDLERKGIHQAKKFNWDDSSKKLYELFESIVNEK